VGGGLWSVAGKSQNAIDTIFFLLLTDH